MATEYDIVHKRQSSADQSVTVVEREKRIILHEISIITSQRVRNSWFVTKKKPESSDVEARAWIAIKMHGIYECCSNFSKSSYACMSFLQLWQRTNIHSTELWHGNESQRWQSLWFKTWLTHQSCLYNLAAHSTVPYMCSVLISIMSVYIALITFYE